MSKALEAWGYYRGVQLDFTRPGKPTDNSHIETSSVYSQTVNLMGEPTRAPGAHSPIGLLCRTI